MGAFCGEIVGMFQEEFPPDLFYQVRVPAKCLGVAWLECSVPGWDLSLLGAGEFSPELPSKWFHPEAYSPQGLGKGVIFWA